MLNKHFQELLAITRAHSALIQATMYMGYFVMAIPAGMFITRWGYRRGVVFGLLLYGIGSLLFIPGQYMMSFNMFLFSLFVIGCGLCFWNCSESLCDRARSPGTAASRLNLPSLSIGLGCIFAPLLAGLLLFSEEDQAASGNVALPYTCMGVVVLLVALVFSRVRLPEIKHEVELDDQGHRVGLWSHRLFIFGLAALLRMKSVKFPSTAFYQLCSRAGMDDCPSGFSGSFVWRT